MPPPISTVKPSAPTATLLMFRLSSSLSVDAKRLLGELLAVASRVMLSSSAKCRPSAMKVCAVPSEMVTTPGIRAASTSIVEIVNAPKLSEIPRNVARSAAKLTSAAKFAKSVEAALLVSVTCKVI